MYIIPFLLLLYKDSVSFQNFSPNSNIKITGIRSQCMEFIVKTASICALFRVQPWWETTELQCGPLWNNRQLTNPGGNITSLKADAQQNTFG